MSKLTGTLGTDWLRKHGVKGTITDAMLRECRDYLESALRSDLNVESDLAIAEKTFFVFNTPSELHTIVEIESFARRALDGFLDKQARMNL